MAARYGIITKGNMMAVRARGSKFQADFMWKGKRYRPEFDTYNEALAWESQTKANLLLGKPIDDPSKASPGAAPSTIKGLVDYVARNHWANKKAAATLIRNAELFAEFTGPATSTISALTTDKVHEYCRDLERRGRSGSTVNRHLSAISTLSRIAVAKRMLDRKPELSWQANGQGRLRFLEPWEFDVLIKTLNDWGRVEDVIFYEFLVDTGARLSEALKLGWRDVICEASKPTMGVIRLVDRKSGRTTGMPLTKRVKAGLVSLEAGPRGQQAGPFTHITKGGQTALWRRLQTHLPFLRDCVPHHVFRHTTASWLVQRGVDLYRVKEFMDHASLLTTQRYAHLSPRHMEEAVKVLEQEAAE